MDAPICQPCDEPMLLDGLVWHCRWCKAWRWAEPPTKDPYLTGRKVAELLGISQRQVWRYVESGELPPRETWRRSTIEPLKEKIAAHLESQRHGKHQRRDPRAARYTRGRHRFDATPRPPSLTVDEVAARLGASRWQVYAWARLGIIPSGPWYEETIAPLVGKVQPPKRGRKIAWAYDGRKPPKRKP